MLASQLFEGWKVGEWVLGIYSVAIAAILIAVALYVILCGINRLLRGRLHIDNELWLIPLALVGLLLGLPTGHWLAQDEADELARGVDNIKAIVDEQFDPWKYGDFRIAGEGLINGSSAVVYQDECQFKAMFKVFEGDIYIRIDNLTDGNTTVSMERAESPEVASEFVSEHCPQGVN